MDIVGTFLTSPVASCGTAVALFGECKRNKVGMDMGGEEEKRGDMYVRESVWRCARSECGLFSLALFSVHRWFKPRFSCCPRRHCGFGDLHLTQLWTAKTTYLHQPRI